MPPNVKKKKKGKAKSKISSVLEPPPAVQVFIHSKIIR